MIPSLRVETQVATIDYKDLDWLPFSVDPIPVLGWASLHRGTCGLYRGPASLALLPELAGIGRPSAHFLHVRTSPARLHPCLWRSGTVSALPPSFLTGTTGYLPDGLVVRPSESSRTAYLHLSLGHLARPHAALRLHEDLRCEAGSSATIDVEIRLGSIDLLVSHFDRHQSPLPPQLAQPSLPDGPAHSSSRTTHHRERCDGDFQHPPHSGLYCPPPSLAKTRRTGQFSQASSARGFPGRNLLPLCSTDGFPGRLYRLVGVPLFAVLRDRLGLQS